MGVEKGGQTESSEPLRRCSPKVVPAEGHQEVREPERACVRAAAGAGRVVHCCCMLGVQRASVAFSRRRHPAVPGTALRRGTRPASAQPVNVQPDVYHYSSLESD